ncbi:sensor histidine kinase [Paenibacillus sp. ACRRX]|uniref:sensor histidine kinase n=1 Tax=unclassified Paenibacillus TaxID=185978 RepID=UPI001EF4C4A2|nr:MULTISPECIES: sensor histidine kinase [unclassified Paenibacillus]MCG7408092.1 sensor histidine kinase [Paenibacillus sp. ACRRX]MDK8181525.1 sensor histidine kinase [Paenibacillus sp. UMB4589-SE434]
MFRHFYQRYFKRKLFNKLIVIYSLIAVVSLVTLSVFAYQFYARKDINTAVMEQQRTVDTINRYFDQKSEIMQAMMQQLYQDNTLIEDTIYLLEHSYENYLKFRLDAYSKSNSFYTRDFRDFYANQFLKDSDIRNIILYSQKQHFAYMFSGKGDPKLYEWKGPGQETPEFIVDRYVGIGKSPIKQPNTLTDTPSNVFDLRGYATVEESISNNKISDTGGVAVTSERTFVTINNRINNKETLMTAGEISIDFNTSGIERNIDYEQREAQYAVMNGDGQMIYYSKTWDMKRFEQNAGKVFAKDRNNSEPIKLDGYGTTYVNMSQMNKLGLTVIALLPQESITSHLSGLRNTIMFVTALIIIAVVSLTYFSVIHLSRRTQSIVMAMKKVQDGNLETRIPVNQEDELGLIAQSFNRMCEDLKQYINRFYKSELKQKHAELIALQAQIKPHFLYNTLEVIRMRAVSKGAHDVGDMIYNLASIFRHMVKDKTMILLYEEIENSKRYLELTRLRYRDKLQYTIRMDEHLGGYNIMKLSVQPIIENYLVHGLGLERTDNHILIEAVKADNCLVISVSDNGKGIPPERLQQIQNDLNHPELTDHGSLGLKNVHDRLKILYGEQAGLTIDSVVNSGTVVTLRVPLQ